MSNVNIITKGTAAAGRLSALTAAYTIGTEATNAITVNVQLKSAVNDQPILKRVTVYGYLSDDANGDSIAGTAPSGGIAAGTDGWLDPVTANKSFMATTESDGDLDIVITETGADTWYLALVMPESGERVMSGAITFAA